MNLASDRPPCCARVLPGPALLAALPPAHGAGAAPVTVVPCEGPDAILHNYDLGWVPQ